MLNLNHEHKAVIYWQTAYLTLVYLYAFTLPLSVKINAVVFIALAAYWLVYSFRFNFKLKKFFTSPYAKVLAFYLVLLCLSILVSDNKGNSLKYLTLQTSIFLLPLVFYKKLSPNQTRFCLKLYVLGCILISFFALYKNYTENFNSFAFTAESLGQVDWTYFSYMLPISVKFHAPYFSLYCCTALIITFWFCLTHIQKREFWKAGFLGIASGYLFAFSGVLASRSSLAFTIIVLTVALLVWGLKERRYVAVLVILSLAPILAFYTYKKVPYLKSKLESSAGLDERLTLWENGLEVIKNNLFLGTGTGDTQDTLTNTYKENGFENGVKEELNMHNQYLETTVGLGIIGLLTLLSMYFLIFRSAFVQKKIILICFISVFSLCSLTESLLDGRAGVLLFSFIVSLMLLNPMHSETESRSIEEGSL